MYAISPAMATYFAAGPALKRMAAMFENFRSNPTLEAMPTFTGRLLSGGQLAAGHHRDGASGGHGATKGA